MWITFFDLSYVYDLLISFYQRNVHFHMFLICHAQFKSKHPIGVKSHCSDQCKYFQSSLEYDFIAYILHCFGLTEKIERIPFYPISLKTVPQKWQKQLKQAAHLQLQLCLN